MTISITVLAMTGVFRGGGGSPAASGSSSPKDDGIFNRLSYSLKRLAQEAVEVLPAMVGSVIGAILRFLSKAIGFVVKHTSALTVFVASLILI